MKILNNRLVLTTRQHLKEIQIFRNNNIQHEKWFHTNDVRRKFLTNTEIIHKGVVYGRSAYQTRPNDPRVPSNPLFGIIKSRKQQPELVTADELENGSFSKDISEKKLKVSMISKAMKSYLERSNKHNEFIRKQEEEFESGRRHLANMMGLNIETMTQKDIDIAIKYLMPSGLFDPRARPRMKHPKEIYPTIKEAQFRYDGRPFHDLFYTGRANFYQACYDIEQQLNKLKKFEDDQIKSGQQSSDSSTKVKFLSSNWLDHREMKSLFLEKLEVAKYEAFINALEQLADYPNSKLCEEFLMKYRKKTELAAQLLDIPPLKYDDDGRPYMNAAGRRKLCVAYVTVRGNGTGKVDINGKDILYFKLIQDREQVMTPLKFCGLLNKVDIECRTCHLEMTRKYSEDDPPFPHNVRELGFSAQSGAIRLALSLALKSFVPMETVEKMRLVGLLDMDMRLKMRKKWGQEGARRKYTWKKR